MNHLDMIHARILLVELLRETAPEIEGWGDQVLADAVWLSMQLAEKTNAEELRRKARAGEGGRQTK